MTKKIKYLAIPLVALTLFNCTTKQNLSATTNTDIIYNNKMTVGRNIYYYIDPSNLYTSSIPNAVNKLMYPVGMNNDLVLSRTYNKQNSKIDFYMKRERNGVNASASVWKKNSAGEYYAMPVNQKDTYDWVYGEVTLNDYYMSNYSTTIRENIIIHEMLHVYGCKDINKPTSIMHYTNGWSSTVKGVTSDANNVINTKY
jgi:hypothetical protein